MSPPTYSLVINHAPWIPERRECVSRMLLELLPLSHGVPFLLNDRDYRGQDWQAAKVTWALEQWRWSAKQATEWHLFMTDDLELAPGFHKLMTAILHACRNESAIGFLSNSPQGARVDTVVRNYASSSGWCHFYRTNSWIVGPCYALTHECLLAFLAHFEALPDGPHTVEGTKAWANDDSSINEFITRSGRSTVHPVPTIIEHRGDIGSTTGHGDKFSRERMSWRAQRWTADRLIDNEEAELRGHGRPFVWHEAPATWPLEPMGSAAWWGDPKDATLVVVGE